MAYISVCKNAQKTLSKSARFFEEVSLVEYGGVKMTKVKRKPFVMVTKALFNDIEINSSDIAVMSALCSFAIDNGAEDRTAYPTRKQLRERARVADMTLSKCVTKLKDKGYIEIVPRYTEVEGKTNRGRSSNMYVIKNV